MTLKKKQSLFFMLKNNCLKLINSIVKLCLELFIFDRHLRRRLKGKFCQCLLKKYIRQVEKEFIQNPKPHTIGPYRIWQYWNSGEENAPDLVRACLASVDKFRGNVERVILNDNNIKDYVTIPDFIYELREKGIISNTHFSDILRTYLLDEHGGCWIDATVLLTAPLPDFIRESELFVLQNDREEDADNLGMTSYFISSKGHSVIIAKIKRLLELYWNDNNFLINYFLFLHAFSELMLSSEENIQEVNEMHKFSYLDVQRMEKQLLEPYTKERWNELTAISPIHKLSYKWKVIAKRKKVNLANTIYEFLIENFGFPLEYKGIGKPNKVNILQNIKSWFMYYFSFIDVDDHYVLKLFGAKICMKHKIKLCCPEIQTSGVTGQKRKRELIVSLTTYPARINTVYQTISTLLNQTIKPDRVVLWLAKEQFEGLNLPENLTQLQKYGLEIKWCEDIKSYKKLVPSLREYPNGIIITADDDIFYPSDFVESLYNQYLKYPQFINANRAFVIKRKNQKYVMKARNYCYNFSYLPAYTNEFMTGYGTLFPPYTLDKNVLNSSEFMKLMPTNDDVWFWGMAVKKGTKINVNPNGYKVKLLIDRSVQDSALWKLNMDNTTVGTGGSEGVNIIAENYAEVKSILSKTL